MNSPIFSATYRQMELLRYIAGYQAKHNGKSPSYAEICRSMGLVSKSSVHRLMSSLQQRGYINRSRHAARDIEVLRAPPLPRDAEGHPRYFIPVDRLAHHGGLNA